MDLAKRYVVGKGGWPPRGRGTERGSRHQAWRNRWFTEASCSLLRVCLLFSLRLHLTRSNNIGSRKPDVQWRKTQMAETVAPSEAYYCTKLPISKLFPTRAAPSPDPSASQWLFGSRSSRPTRAPCLPVSHEKKHLGTAAIDVSRPASLP